MCWLLKFLYEQASSLISLENNIDVIPNILKNMPVQSVNRAPLGHE